MMAAVKQISAILFLLGLLARPVDAQLTASDVQTIISQAATRALALGAPLNTNAVIAVTDREGWVLGVWAYNTSIANTDPLVALAIGEAGTASFLSSADNAFSSRTAGDIVQQHFPPGIANTPPGPLVGVNFSQLSFSDINKFKAPGSVISYGSSPGLTIVPAPIPITGGLAGAPGGVPLYKNGQLVGGVGVAGNGDTAFSINPAITTSADSDENAALTGQIGYAPSPTIFGSQVFINGIRLEYVEGAAVSVPPTNLASLHGAIVAPYSIIDSPTPLPGNYPYPAATFGGENGELRQPIIDDPSSVPLGVPRLTAADVTNIITAAANRARTTRAGIRLPRGRPAETFITVVNNPNMNGVTPVVLGTFRTSPDATLFSWDVCVQKARTAVFFSATNRAYSSRTVGFLAEQYYPPGINGNEPGIFLGLQERFSILTPTPLTITNPLNNAVFVTTNIPDPNLTNGITIFPGGFPIYRNGVLIGAVGVSGDGVDQDDLVGASGAAVFLPPAPIRADQTQYKGARLPFAKFPRNPSL